MKCIFCGEIGKGSICPDCYPSCINCNSKDIKGTINSKDSEEYGKIVWCKKCLQIIPVEFVTQELPADNMKNNKKEKILGVKIDEVD